MRALITLYSSLTFVKSFKICHKLISLAGTGAPPFSRQTLLNQMSLAILFMTLLSLISCWDAQKSTGSVGSTSSGFGVHSGTLRHALMRSLSSTLAALGPG